MRSLRDPRSLSKLQKSDKLSYVPGDRLSFFAAGKRRHVPLFLLSQWCGASHNTKQTFLPSLTALPKVQNCCSCYNSLGRTPHKPSSAVDRRGHPGNSVQADFFQPRACADFHTWLSPTPPQLIPVWNAKQATSILPVVFFFS